MLSVHKIASLHGINNIVLITEHTFQYPDYIGMRISIIGMFRHGMLKLKQN